jgi:hypothetical protein
MIKTHQCPGKGEIIDENGHHPIATGIIYFNISSSKWFMHCIACILFMGLFPHLDMLIV